MPRTGNPTERAAFLRQILESPYDDIVRLVFADWLTDNGEAKYADYIRFSITHRDTFRHIACAQVSAHDWHKTQLYLSAEYGHRENQAMLTPLDWAPTPLVQWTPRPNSEIKGPKDGWPTETNFYYLRGFVQIAYFTDMSFFMSDYVVDLFRKHPITELRIRDKDCGEIDTKAGRYAVWQRQSVTMDVYHGYPHARARQYMVPDEIYAEIPWVNSDDRGMRNRAQTYPKSRNEGMKWLSNACVTWARKKVGLPPVQFPT